MQHICWIGLALTTVRTSRLHLLGLPPSTSSIVIRLVWSSRREATLSCLGPPFTTRITGWKQLDKAIEDIRARPSGKFESFLKVPAEEEMMEVVVLGPFVVLNVSKYSCEAIIVKTDGIKAHRLPNVTLEGIESKARAASRAGSVGWRYPGMSAESDCGARFINS